MQAVVHTHLMSPELYMYIMNLILWVHCSLLCKSCHVVNDRGKVSGSPQLHRLQGLVVGLHHSGNASTVRILGVSIESKLVRHLQREETDVEWAEEDVVL